ncbi:hypothetical protein [Pseudocnuella soli]|uniref:hypothetical protein n=1 Tax=Pseudocnuella soli TaxID=2502779 RepID=UPI00140519AC|nr:hypothetical protein [Pseudocnuella soli]
MLEFTALLIPHISIRIVARDYDFVKSYAIIKFIFPLLSRAQVVLLAQTFAMAAQTFAQIFIYAAPKCIKKIDSRMGKAKPCGSAKNRNRTGPICMLWHSASAFRRSLPKLFAFLPHNNSREADGRLSETFGTKNMGQKGAGCTH